MKAFIHAMRENGTDKLGTDNATVTNEYKSLETMERYAIMPFIKNHGACHVEAFYNWDNRYGKPNLDIKYDSRGYIISSYKS